MSDVPIRGAGEHDGPAIVEPLDRGLLHRRRRRPEGWPAIALWSRPYQVAGHRLYEALGYERAPERDTVDETGFGRLVFRLAL